MKKKITILLLSFLCLSVAQLRAAQNMLKQVIVLNEGAYGTYVTVGSYDPATKVYQNFDTLNVAFASHVIIDNGFIYVAADTLLVKYDLNTKQRLAVQTVPGIRKLAAWNDQILVTRGTSGSLPSYFQAYGSDSLNLLYESTAVSAQSEGIKVLNDTAYIAINGYGILGKLGVIDLNNRMLNREIDLGANGLDPENVEAEPINGKIYTINNLDWSDASVTKFDVASATFTSTLLNRSSGCSGSAYYLNNVYFQTSGEDKIGLFSTVGLSVWDSLLVNKQIYGMGVDQVNAYLYLSVTDYTTYGKVYVYDFFGTPIDSFSVNISPGNFAFDVGNVAGINEEASSSAKLLVRPNPAKDVVHAAFIDEKNSMVTMTLTDILGREIFNQLVAANSQVTFSVNDYPQGIYFLRATAGNETITQKIVKQ